MSDSTLAWRQSHERNLRAKAAAERKAEEARQHADVDDLVRRFPNLDVAGCDGFATELRTILFARLGVAADPFVPGIDSAFHDLVRAWLRRNLSDRSCQEILRCLVVYRVLAEKDETDLLVARGHQLQAQGKVLEARARAVIGQRNARNVVAAIWATPAACGPDDMDVCGDAADLQTRSN